MTDFMFVAALYYACDQAAIEARLSAGDILRCSQVYETMKIRFLSEAERAALAGQGAGERAATMQTAYRRFKAWEGAHPQLVASLRARDLPASY